MTLAFIWGAIIACASFLYIILDGYDLGIGILFPFFNQEDERDIMISVILPVWDGNETWLVFSGAALYGAFPLAFSMLLPALYLPIFIMVLALLLRGVAFEFRLKAIKSKFIWDVSFFLGSIIAAIAQGIILGAFVQGIKLNSNSAVESLKDWFNPFSLICSVALIFGYSLLGSNRLIAKTQGVLQEKYFAISSKLQYVMVGFVIVVSALTPTLDPFIFHRWFDIPNIFYLSFFPITTFILLFAHWYYLKKRNDFLPFWLSVGVYILCYSGLLISNYPYIIPRILTFQDAAAPDVSLKFMLIGAILLMPILLFYTFYSYGVFKGKVEKKIGY